MLAPMQTPKSDRTPQLADKYIVRLPDGMRDKITELAKANNRSMNAEIVLMLQQAMDARVLGAMVGHASSPVVDMDALADAIADRVAERLKAA